MKYEYVFNIKHKALKAVQAFGGHLGLCPHTCSSPLSVRASEKMVEPLTGAACSLQRGD